MGLFGMVMLLYVCGCSLTSRGFRRRLLSTCLLYMNSGIANGCGWLLWLRMQWICFCQHAECQYVNAPISEYLVAFWHCMHICVPSAYNATSMMCSILVTDPCAPLMMSSFSVYNMWTSLALHSVWWLVVLYYSALILLQMLIQMDISSWLMIILIECMHT